MTVKLDFKIHKEDLRRRRCLSTASRDFTASNEIGPPAPADNVDGEVAFLKIMQRTHGPTISKPCLDIPAKFWRKKEIEFWASKTFTLQGPTWIGQVRSVYKDSKRQEFVFFKSGWKRFYNDNNFKIADKILFKLTAPGHFVVSIVP